MPAKHKAAKKHPHPKPPPSSRPKSSYFIFGAALIIVIVVAVIVFDREAERSEVPEAEVAALVNGEKILVADIKNQYDILPDQFRDQVTLSTVLDQNIEKVLLLQEAERRGITATEEEAAAYVDQLFSQLGFDEGAIEEQLLGRGLTMGDIREMYREQLIMLRLINQTVAPTIKVSDDEINEFYQLNKDNLGALESSREQIIAIIRQAKQPQALSEFVDGLKTDSDIRILKVYP